MSRIRWKSLGESEAILVPDLRALVVRGPHFQNCINDIISYDSYLETVQHQARGYINSYLRLSYATDL